MILTIAPVLFSFPPKKMLWKVSIYHMQVVHLLKEALCSLYFVSFKPVPPLKLILSPFQK